MPWSSTGPWATKPPSPARRFSRPTCAHQYGSEQCITANTLTHRAGHLWLGRRGAAGPIYRLIRNGQFVGYLMSGSRRPGWACRPTAVCGLIVESHPAHPHDQRQPAPARDAGRPDCRYRDGIYLETNRSWPSTTVATTSSSVLKSGGKSRTASWAACYAIARTPASRRSSGAVATPYAGHNTGSSGERPAVARDSPDR